MEIFGYLAAILIGISLGLIGGGGSILTVPVLVYLFGENAVQATGYSLFIVGITSLAGSISYFKKGLVNVKTAVVFGIPSIIAVYATRAFIIPAIPEIVFKIGNFEIHKRLFLIGIFAVLMIIASYSMIRKRKKPQISKNEKQEFNYPLILIEGIVVGMLTGLVGAGGGFLIIPALVMLSKLPMKEAVGTSLVIITVKSLLGFLGEKNMTKMDWNLIIFVSLFAIIGIVIGGILSNKINGEKLKPAFGWFVLAMGIYILITEIIV